MQNNTLTKQQIQAILDGAPETISTESIINGLVERGYTLEGLNDKKEPTLGQTVLGTLIKAPTNLIGAGFAGAGALGAYAGKKLAGEETTLSQEYQNQTQQVQESGANSIVEPLTGEEIRPAQNLEQLGGDAIQTAALASPGIGLVKGAATGAALMGGQAMSDNQSAFDVAKNALTGAAIGGALGVAVPAAEKLIGAAVKTAPKIAQAIKPDSANIMQRVLRVTKGQQAKFEQNYGTSIGQYAVDRGLIGTQEKVATDLANRFTTSIKAADDALASLPGKYQPEPVKTALQELYQKKLATSAKGALDPELNLVKELINKFDNVGLDMSEINQAKRLYERNVKLDFVKTNNPEGVKLANNIDQAIRDWQFTQAERLGLKNLPEINKETRMAKELLNSLERESSGKAGNNAISLTDWIVLADGGATNMAAFLAKKGFSSDTVQAFVAKYFAPKTPKIGLPSASKGTPQIDATVQSYFDFLKKTGAISLGTGKKSTQQIEQKLSPLTDSLPQTKKSATKNVEKSIPKELLPLAEETPKTVKVWVKSKFSDKGAYADFPVIRKEKNITLYQGGSEEGRQFWTPDKKYAEQFGKVQSKTGDFYKVDNGNRVTDVYVEAKPSAMSSLAEEAKKYKSAEEFVNSFEKRFHQTSLENAANIEKQGFRLDLRGSGNSDVLPVGVNTKMTDKPLSILGQGSQIEVAIPKNAKIKTFETRDAAEGYFYSHKEGQKYFKAIEDQKALDKKYTKILNTLEKQHEEFARTNPGREAVIKDLDKQENVIEKWKKESLKLSKIAQDEAAKIAKNEGWDAIQINKDVGSFNRETDNTIIFKPSLLKTKQQLIDLWNKANGKK